MPVKVRCPSCQKVLNVPDAARGKAVKCPGCANRVAVPAGNKQAAPRRVKKVQTTPSQPAYDNDNFLAGVDLRQAEDHRVRICPKCSVEIGFEATECPNCGIDFATGRLSERAKRLRRGPDQDEYWSKVWSSSWNFMLKNVDIALRTGLYWTLFGTVFVLSMWCAVYSLPYGPYMDAEWNAEFEADYHRPPSPVRPPTLFWLALGTIFFLGIPGWYWFLSKATIELTMDKKSRFKRLEFDFFQNLALGVKSVVWPLIISMFLLPVTFVIVLMFTGVVSATTNLGGLTPIIGSLVGFVVWIPFYMVFPISQVHMTQPYTYKAWTPYHMGKLFFKNLVPSLYWCLVALPVALLAIGCFFAVTILILLSLGATPWISSRLLLALGENPEGWMYYLLNAIIGPLMWALIIAPFAFIMAFPALFVARANGIFGYYFKQDLEIVVEQTAGELAGFWPRYLAYLVDYLIIYCALLACWGVWFAFVFAGIAFKMGFLLVIAGILGWVCQLLNLLIPMAYYVKSESGTGQATLGKRALGMIVITEDGKPIQKGTAFGRFFGRAFLSGPIFGIGLVMAGFTEKKQTLHDMMTKTLVVWKGDDTTMR